MGLEFGFSSKGLGRTGLLIVFRFRDIKANRRGPCTVKSIVEA
jgi:hypothetical protein